MPGDVFDWNKLPGEMKNRVYAQLFATGEAHEFNRVVNNRRKKAKETDFQYCSCVDKLDDQDSCDRCRKSRDEGYFVTKGNHFKVRRVPGSDRVSYTPLDGYGGKILELNHQIRLEAIDYLYSGHFVMDLPGAFKLYCQTVGPLSALIGELTIHKFLPTAHKDTFSSIHAGSMLNKLTIVCTPGRRWTPTDVFDILEPLFHKFNKGGYHGHDRPGASCDCLEMQLPRMLRILDLSALDGPDDNGVQVVQKTAFATLCNLKIQQQAASRSVQN
ncbi:hypothetical protein LTR15_000546 [Elasticomyces elasticus]|nr:hypothetical protein LTR15_000546 [Elasticomyces elasticus]